MQRPRGTNYLRPHNQPRVFVTANPNTLTYNVHQPSVTLTCNMEYGDEHERTGSTYPDQLEEARNPIGAQENATASQNVGARVFNAHVATPQLSAEENLPAILKRKCRVNDVQSFPNLIVSSLSNSTEVSSNDRTQQYNRRRPLETFVAPKPLVKSPKKRLIWNVNLSAKQKKQLMENNWWLGHVEKTNYYMSYEYAFNASSDPFMDRHKAKVGPVLASAQTVRERIKVLNIASRSSSNIIKDRAYYVREFMIMKSMITYRIQTTQDIPRVKHPPSLECGYYPADVTTKGEAMKYLRERYYESVVEYQNLSPCMKRFDDFLVKNNLALIEISSFLLYDYHQDGRHIHGFFWPVAAVDNTKRVYLIDIFNNFMYPVYAEYNSWPEHIKYSFDINTSFNLHLAEVYNKNASIINSVETLLRAYKMDPQELKSVDETVDDDGHVIGREFTVKSQDSKLFRGYEMIVGGVKRAEDDFDENFALIYDDLNGVEVEAVQEAKESNIYFRMIYDKDQKRVQREVGQSQPDIAKVPAALDETSIFKSSKRLKRSVSVTDDYMPEFDLPVPLRRIMSENTLLVDLDPYLKKMEKTLKDHNMQQTEKKRRGRKLKKVRGRNAREKNLARFEEYITSRKVIDNPSMPNLDKHVNQAIARIDFTTQGLKNIFETPEEVHEIEQYLRFISGLPKSGFAPIPPVVKTNLDDLKKSERLRKIEEAHNLGFPVDCPQVLAMETLTGKEIYNQNDLFKFRSSLLTSFRGNDDEIAESVFDSNKQKEDEQLEQDELNCHDMMYDENSFITSPQTNISKMYAHHDHFEYSIYDILQNKEIFIDAFTSFQLLDVLSVFDDKDKILLNEVGDVAGVTLNGIYDYYKQLKTRQPVIDPCQQPFFDIISRCFKFRVASDGTIVWKFVNEHNLLMSSMDDLIFSKSDFQDEYVSEPPEKKRKIQDCFALEQPSDQYEHSSNTERSENVTIPTNSLVNPQLSHPENDDESNEQLREQMDVNFDDDSSIEPTPVKRATDDLWTFPENKSVILDDASTRTQEENNEQDEFEYINSPTLEISNDFVFSHSTNEEAVAVIQISNFESTSFSLNVTEKTFVDNNEQFERIEVEATCEEFEQTQLELKIETPIHIVKVDADRRKSTEAHILIHEVAETSIDIIGADLMFEKTTSDEAVDATFLTSLFAMTSTTVNYSEQIFTQREEIEENISTIILEPNESISYSITHRDEQLSKKPEEMGITAELMIEETECLSGEIQHSNASISNVPCSRSVAATIEINELELVTNYIVQNTSNLIKEPEDQRTIADVIVEEDGGEVSEHIHFMSTSLANEESVESILAELNMEEIVSTTHNVHDFEDSLTRTGLEECTTSKFLIEENVSIAADLINTEPTINNKSTEGTLTAQFETHEHLEESCSVVNDQLDIRLRNDHQVQDAEVQIEDTAETSLSIILNDELKIDQQPESSKADAQMMTEEHEMESFAVTSHKSDNFKMPIISRNSETEVIQHPIDESSLHCIAKEMEVIHQQQEFASTSIFDCFEHETTTLFVTNYQPPPAELEEELLEQSEAISQSAENVVSRTNIEESSEGIQTTTLHEKAPLEQLEAAPKPVSVEISVIVSENQENSENIRSSILPNKQQLEPDTTSNFGGIVVEEPEVEQNSSLLQNEVLSEKKVIENSTNTRISILLEVSALEQTETAPELASTVLDRSEEQEISEVVQNENSRKEQQLRQPDDASKLAEITVESSISPGKHFEATTDVENYENSSITPNAILWVKQVMEQPENTSALVGENSATIETAILRDKLTSEQLETAPDFVNTVSERSEDRKTSETIRSEVSSKKQLLEQPEAEPELVESVVGYLESQENSKSIRSETKSDRQLLEQPEIATKIDKTVVARSKTEENRKNYLLNNTVSEPIMSETNFGTEEARQPETLNENEEQANNDQFENKKPNADFKAIAEAIQTMRSFLPDEISSSVTHLPIIQIGDYFESIDENGPLETFDIDGGLQFSDTIAQSNNEESENLVPPQTQPILVKPVSEFCVCHSETSAKRAYILNNQSYFVPTTEEEWRALKNLFNSENKSGGSTKESTPNRTSLVSDHGWCNYSEESGLKEIVKHQPGGHPLCMACTNQEVLNISECACTPTKRDKIVVILNRCLPNIGSSYIGRFSCNHGLNRRLVLIVDNHPCQPRATETETDRRSEVDHSVSNNIAISSLDYRLRNPMYVQPINYQQQPQQWRGQSTIHHQIVHPNTQHVPQIFKMEDDRMDSISQSQQPFANATEQHQIAVGPPHNYRTPNPLNDPFARNLQGTSSQAQHCPNAQQAGMSLDNLEMNIPQQNHDVLQESSASSHTNWNQDAKQLQVTNERIRQSSMPVLQQNLSVNQQVQGHGLQSYMNHQNNPIGTRTVSQQGYRYDNFEASSNSPTSTQMTSQQHQTGDLLQHATPQKPFTLPLSASQKRSFSSNDVSQAPEPKHPKMTKSEKAQNQLNTPIARPPQYSTDQPSHLAHLRTLAMGGMVPPPLPHRNIVRQNSQYAQQQQPRNTLSAVPHQPHQAYENFGAPQVDGLVSQNLQGSPHLVLYQPNQFSNSAQLERNYPGQLFHQQQHFPWMEQSGLNQWQQAHQVSASTPSFTPQTAQGNQQPRHDQFPIPQIAPLLDSRSLYSQPQQPNVPPMQATRNSIGIRSHVIPTIQQSQPEMAGTPQPRHTMPGQHPMNQPVLYGMNQPTNNTFVDQRISIDGQYGQGMQMAPNQQQFSGTPASAHDGFNIPEQRNNMNYEAQPSTSNAHPPNIQDSFNRNCCCNHSGFTSVNCPFHSRLHEEELAARMPAQQTINDNYNNTHFAGDGNFTNSTVRYHPIPNQEFGMFHGQGNVAEPNNNRAAPNGNNAANNIPNGQYQGYRTHATTETMFPDATVEEHTIQEQPVNEVEPVNEAVRDESVPLSPSQHKETVILEKVPHAASPVEFRLTPTGSSPSARSTASVASPFNNAGENYGLSPSRNLDVSLLSMKVNNYDRNLFEDIEIDDGSGLLTGVQYHASPEYHFIHHADIEVAVEEVCSDPIIDEKRECQLRGLKAASQKFTIDIEKTFNSSRNDDDPYNDRERIRSKSAEPIERISFDDYKQDRGLKRVSSLCNLAEIEAYAKKKAVITQQKFGLFVKDHCGELLEMDSEEYLKELFDMDKLFGRSEINDATKFGFMKTFLTEQKYKTILDEEYGELEAEKYLQIVDVFEKIPLQSFRGDKNGAKIPKFGDGKLISGQPISIAMDQWIDFKAFKEDALQYGSSVIKTLPKWKHKRNCKLYKLIDAYILIFKFRLALFEQIFRRIGSAVFNALSTIQAERSHSSLHIQKQTMKIKAQLTNAKVHMFDLSELRSLMTQHQNQPKILNANRPLNNGNALAIIALERSRASQLLSELRGEVVDSDEIEQFSHSVDLVQLTLQDIVPEGVDTAQLLSEGESLNYSPDLLAAQFESMDFNQNLPLSTIVNAFFEQIKCFYGYIEKILGCEVDRKALLYVEHRAFTTLMRLLHGRGVFFTRSDFRNTNSFTNGLLVSAAASGTRLQYDLEYHANMIFTMLEDQSNVPVDAPMMQPPLFGISYRNNRNGLHLALIVEDMILVDRDHRVSSKRYKQFSVCREDMNKVFVIKGVKCNIIVKKEVVRVKDTEKIVDAVYLQLLGEMDEPLSDEFAIIRNMQEYGFSPSNFGPLVSLVSHSLDNIVNNPAAFIPSQERPRRYIFKHGMTTPSSTEYITIHELVKRRERMAFYELGDLYEESEVQGFELVSQDHGYANNLLESTREIVYNAENFSYQTRLHACDFGASTSNHDHLSKKCPSLPPSHIRSLDEQLGKNMDTAIELYNLQSQGLLFKGLESNMDIDKNGDADTVAGNGLFVNLNGDLRENAAAIDFENAENVEEGMDGLLADSVDAFFSFSQVDFDNNDDNTP